MKKKAKIKFGDVVVHPSEISLIAYYSKNNYEIDDNNIEYLISSENCSKTINLQGLSVSSSLQSAADAILNKSKYIHASQKNKIMECLNQLKERMKNEKELQEQKEKELQELQEQKEKELQEQKERELQEQKEKELQELQEQKEKELQEQKEKELQEQKEKELQELQEQKEKELQEQKERERKEAEIKKSLLTSTINQQNLQKIQEEKKLAEQALEELKKKVLLKQKRMEEDEKSRQHIIKKQLIQQKDQEAKKKKEILLHQQEKYRHIDKPIESETKIKKKKKNKGPEHFTIDSSLPFEDQIEICQQGLYEDNENYLTEVINYLYQIFIFSLQNIPSHSDSNYILSQFLSNDILMNALSRLVFEIGLRNIELSLNIMKIFSIFSQYPLSHHKLSSLTIGRTAITIIKYETHRYNNVIAPKLSDNLSIKQLSTNLLQQTSLLSHCYYLLINLSIDPLTEAKMVIRGGLIKLLAQTLTRRHIGDKSINLVVTDLFYLSFLFLKKLSIFTESRKEIEKCGIITIISIYHLPFITKDMNETELKTLNVIILLLYNLSFDFNHVENMLNNELLPEIIKCLYYPSPSLNISTLKLLYNISNYHQLSSTISNSILSMNNTNSPNLIYYLIETINQPSKSIKPDEIFYLLLNFSLNSDFSQFFFANVKGNRAVSLLISPLKQYDNNIILKIFSNLSSNNLLDDNQHLIPYYYDFINLSKKYHTTPHLLVECLKILSYIPPNFQKHDDSYNFFCYLISLLSINVYEDDIILATLCCVNNITSYQTCSNLLNRNSFVKKLNTILNQRAQDLEIVTQILFTLIRIVTFSSFAKQFCADFSFVSRLLSYSTSAFPLLRLISDRLLDSLYPLFSYYFSPDEIQQIILYRFKHYNHHWIEAIENEPELAPEPEIEIPEIPDNEWNIPNPSFSTTLFLDSFSQ